MLVGGIVVKELDCSEKGDGDEDEVSVIDTNSAPMVDAAFGLINTKTAVLFMMMCHCLTNI